MKRKTVWDLEYERRGWQEYQTWILGLTDLDVMAAGGTLGGGGGGGKGGERGGRGSEGGKGEGGKDPSLTDLDVLAAGGTLGGGGKGGGEGGGKGEGGKGEGGGGEGEGEEEGREGGRRVMSLALMPTFWGAPRPPPVAVTPASGATLAPGARVKATGGGLGWAPLFPIPKEFIVRQPRRS